MIYDSVTLRGVIRSNLPPSLGAALSMGPAMGPGSMFGEPNERFCETVYKELPARMVDLCVHSHDLEVGSISILLMERPDKVQQ